MIRQIFIICTTNRHIGLVINLLSIEYFRFVLVYEYQRSVCHLRRLIIPVLICTLFLANFIFIFVQKLNFSDKIYVRANVEKCIICKREVTDIYLSSYSTLTYLIIVNILQSMKLELEYNVSVDI